MLNPPMPNEIRPGLVKFWKLFFGETFHTNVQLQEMYEAYYGDKIQDSTIGARFRELRLEFDSTDKRKTDWKFERERVPKKSYYRYRILHRPQQKQMGLF